MNRQSVGARAIRGTKPPDAKITALCAAQPPDSFAGKLTDLFR
jgi:hypothetical protein